jgi:hypothetical protein
MSNNAANLVNGSLLHFPLEIIELIVLNIVGLSNLLSLSLTCRVLASIILPRHLRYHTVRASLAQADIWKHLIRNRTCARNVRQLEIVPDEAFSPSRYTPFFQAIISEEDMAPDDSLYPSDPSDPSNTSDKFLLQSNYDLWRERLLVIALGGMSNLRSFAWLCDSPPVLSVSEDIWSVLRQKQYLSDVELQEEYFDELADGVSPPEDEINIRSLLVSPVSNTL